MVEARTVADPLPAVSPVIVRIPGDITCRPVEIAVHHYEWGVEVDYREKSEHSWIPIGYVGGTFEVRPR